MASTAEFTTIGVVSELPVGERLVVEVNGTWIIVFNVDGDYYAIEDLCSHEEYYLADGTLEGYSIECPKHGANFDIRTGKPLCPPAVSPIKRFSVRVEGDAIQVGGRL